MKFILIALVLGLLYIRFAPIKVDRAHIIPDITNLDTDQAGSYLATLADQTPANFARLYGVISNTPRTVQIAGSVEAGHVSFVTRSLIMGFPDVTSIGIGEDGVIWVYGRLVYGHSDFNVNKTRIQNWLQSL